MRISGRPFSIKTIVTEHIKMLFRDMDNQFFDEFTSVFDDSNFLIVLMALIPVSDIGTIVSGDTGLSHDGSSDITDDIVNDSISRGKVRRRSVNIETVVFDFVKGVYKLFKIGGRKCVRVKGIFHVGKKCGHPFFTEHFVREKVYMMPFAITVQSAFGDDHMYVGVPFEITSKGMKTADHPGF